jgi:hypothetical protein
MTNRKPIIKIFDGKKTQKKWAEYFNGLRSGAGSYEFASLSDVFQYFEWIQGQEPEQTKKLAEAFRKSLDSAQFLTSDSVKYALDLRKDGRGTGNDSSAYVTKHTGSPNQSTVAVGRPPIHLDTYYLDRIVENEDGLRFAQAIFGTQKDGSTIVGVVGGVFQTDVVLSKVDRDHFGNSGKEQQIQLERVCGLGFDRRGYIITDLFTDEKCRAIGIKYEGK